MGAVARATTDAMPSPVGRNARVLAARSGSVGAWGTTDDVALVSPAEAVVVAIVMTGWLRGANAKRNIDDAGRNTRF